MSHPIIALNVDVTQDIYHKDVTYLSPQYADAIAHAGGHPIHIAPIADKDYLNEVLDVVQGVVLVGGADLDCTNDGFQIHPSMHLLHPRREKCDRLLAKLIRDRQMPVFGIGAGMQLLNVTCGGSLYLNIADDLPKAMPHRDRYDEFNGHELLCKEGSMVHRCMVCDTIRIRVNSFHHMAIDEVAEGFYASAKAPDGVVEAIEHTNGWLAMGTQFHPEHHSASPLAASLLEEWIAQIKAHATVPD